MPDQLSTQVLAFFQHRAAVHLEGFRAQYKNIREHLYSSVYNEELRDKIRLFLNENGVAIQWRFAQVNAVMWRGETVFQINDFCIDGEWQDTIAMLSDALDMRIELANTLTATLEHQRQISHAMHAVVLWKWAGNAPLAFEGELLAPGTRVHYRPDGVYTKFGEIVCYDPTVGKYIISNNGGKDYVEPQHIATV